MLEKVFLQNMGARAISCRKKRARAQELRIVHIPFTVR
jgi:hypothetical protein